MTLTLYSQHCVLLYQSLELCLPPSTNSQQVLPSPLSYERDYSSPSHLALLILTPHTSLSSYHAHPPRLHEVSLVATLLPSARAAAIENRNGIGSYVAAHIKTNDARVNELSTRFSRTVEIHLLCSLSVVGEMVKPLPLFSRLLPREISQMSQLSHVWGVNSQLLLPSHTAKTPQATNANTAQFSTPPA